MTGKTDSMRKIVLQAEDGPRSFLGYVVVDLSLDPAMVIEPPENVNWRPRYRWTDMTLYRVVDPQVAAEYAVHVVGRSMLYHRVGGPCRKGVIRTVLDLEEDARFDLLRPCQEPGCYPTIGMWHHMEELPGEARVAVEEERYTLLKCADASDVIDRLHDEDGDISALAVKLLREAAEKDDGIAAAMTVERPL